MTWGSDVVGSLPVSICLSAWLSLALSIYLASGLSVPLSPSLSLPLPLPLSLTLPSVCTSRKAFAVVYIHGKPVYIRRWILGNQEKAIQTTMAQDRSTRIISMIEWIRTSRLSLRNSLSIRTWGRQPLRRRTCASPPVMHINWFAV